MTATEGQVTETLETVTAARDLAMTDLLIVAEINDQANGTEMAVAVTDLVTVQVIDLPTARAIATEVEIGTDLATVTGVAIEDVATTAMVGAMMIVEATVEMIASDEVAAMTVGATAEIETTEEIEIRIRVTVAATMETTAAARTLHQSQQGLGTQRLKPKKMNQKQKRGYKDQWPWKIKIYTNDDGTLKGDAVITYEDANAARTAPSFFNGGNSDKMKDLSDDSASHDDTIGSYEGVPGDVIDNRYEILRDAGLGTFGRVLLCKDLQSDSKKDIVALKVVRKVEKYSESAKIEANILKHVNEKDENGDSLCVRMHRWYVHLRSWPSRTQMCKGLSSTAT
ncbi:hypothetical protein DYB32_004560 [Aphanomyces invadans]|uniref:Protein kinase domain-containing protein n=1 Tax=Aphanomyces invadans TaxID=157072 RepID=A0A418AX51_9STRA|nr:hypothetical protein DYB32_004560 [Aphanomyces invadans]